ncbi:MAG: baseplate J/gp47 family protein, partial [Acidobacteriota bacterium]
RERRLLAAGLGLLILIILGAVMIFLPKANIKLVLATAPLLVDQTLVVRPNETGQTGIIPGAAYVREVKVDGVSPVTSTIIEGTKATGVVAIINRTTAEQQIRDQSRLVTDDGQLYYMQTHAIIPPEGAVSVPVEAAEAGEQGNFASGRLNFAALDSSAQSVVYGEVREPIDGGSGTQVPIIKAADLENARAEAAASARQKVEEEIRAELPEGWVLLEESWDSQIEEFITEDQEEEQQESITYSGRIMVHVMGYEQTVLEEYLRTTLESQLDQDYMLFPGPISFTKSIDNIDWEQNEATLTVRVTHTTVPDFSLATLQDKLNGRSREEALNYLQGLPGVEGAEVQLTPFWVRHIPRIDRRISIDLISNRQP